MATEIIPRLYVGDLTDGLEWSAELDRDQAVICVLEYAPPEALPFRGEWLPLLKQLRSGAGEEAAQASLTQLRKIEAAIDLHLAAPRRRVLVHCAAGAERAPLAIAWYLRERHHGMTLDEAYLLLQRKRPFVQDRRDWLPKLTDSRCHVIERAF